MIKIVDEIKKEIAEYEFSQTKRLLNEDFAAIRFELVKQGIDVFEVRILDDYSVQVQFSKAPGHYPEFHERDWEGYAAINTVATIILADVICFGKSKSWVGGTPRYESLKHILSRVDIAPIEIFQTDDQKTCGRINVIFGRAVSVPSPHDLAQRPSEPDSDCWDDYRRYVHAGDKIRKELETQNCSQVWRGSMEVFNKLQEYLSLSSIYATNVQNCGEYYRAVFQRRQPAVRSAMPTAIKAFWSRRGHPNIRVDDICVIDQAQSTIIVHLRNRHHITLECKTRSTANAVRHSLVMATCRPEPVGN